jgi:hypothetical protein
MIDRKSLSPRRTADGYDGFRLSPLPILQLLVKTLGEYLWVFGNYRGIG